MKYASLAMTLGAALLISPGFATETSVPFIKADQVHAQGVTGLGVTVAVIDSGVDYALLSGSIAPGGVSIEYGRPVYDGGADIDGSGHGTLVSLIITDLSGVAPDADILPIRASSPALGGILPFDVYRAVQYATGLEFAQNIRVINVSLGSLGTAGAYSYPCDSRDFNTRFLAKGISRAAAARIITFSGVGNDANCGGIRAPACISTAVPVAASYDGYYGTVTFDPPGCTDISPDPYWVGCFSNVAEDSDYFLAAPGYSISVGDFSEWWGTSFATPHCSGVAALMFSKDACGSLSAYQARDIIYDTAATYEWAYPWCPLSPQPKHVDALAAVNAVGGPTCAVVGDLDCDELVSAYDYQRFEQCMSGPDAAYAHTFCACTDFPESPADGDIDLRDLRLLELGLDGWGSGACCHADGTCSVTTVYDCLGETGGTYNGHDSTCADADCEMTRYNNTIDPPAGYAPAGAGLKLADDLTLNGTGGGMLTGYWLLVYGGGGGTFNVTVQLYTACPGEGGTPIAGTQYTFNSLPDGEAVDLIADFDPPVYIPHNVWMVATFSNTQAGWFIAEQAELGYTEDRFARYGSSWGCWYWYGSGGPYSGFWAALDCALVTGACCLPDESCIAGTTAECSAAGGVYQGDATTCAQVNCAAPTGACCRPNGTCTEVTEPECAALSGTFHAQTTCGAVDCTPERYSNTSAPPYDYAGPSTGMQMADDLTLAGTGAGNLIHYDVLVYRPPGGAYNVTASLHTACPPTTANQIAGTTYTWSNVAAGAGQTLNADFPPVSISGTVWLRLQFSVTDAGWIIAGQAETGSTQDRFGAAAPSWNCYYWFEGSPWAGFWANLTFGGGREMLPSEAVTWVESTVLDLPPTGIPYSVVDDQDERILDEPPLWFDADLGHVRLLAQAARVRAARAAVVTLHLNSPVAGQSIDAGSTVDWQWHAQVSTGDNSGLALLSADLIQDASNPELFDIPPATAIGAAMTPFDRPAGISNPAPSGSAFGGTQVGPPGALNLVQIGGSQNIFGIVGLETGLDVNVDAGVAQSGPALIASGSFLAPTTPGTYTFRLANAVANVLDAVGTPPAHSPVSAATTDVSAAAFSFIVGPAVCRGDANCDGQVDFADINPFADALVHGIYCDGTGDTVDVNGVNGPGFDDINPFVDLLMNNPLPINCP